jgi:L-rhamnose 1-dehydrogenase
MDLLLKNKNIAITGCTTGIGRGMALGLAKEGANIATVYLPTDAERGHLKSLEREILEVRSKQNPSTNSNGAPPFVAIEGDVSNSETLENLCKLTVATFGELNVMIANAGITRTHDFPSASDELYHEQIRVNMDGVYYAVKQAARVMKAQGNGGSIIVTASIRSLMGGSRYVEYSASKGGVLSVVQSAAAALGPFNIRCNAILPGAIDTQTKTTRTPTELENRKKVLSRIPMNRFGKPADLAGPAVFLSSDMSEYMNGSQLLVDGGMFNNLE